MTAAGSHISRFMEDASLQESSADHQRGEEKKDRKGSVGPGFTVPGPSWPRALPSA